MKDQTQGSDAMNDQHAPQSPMMDQPIGIIAASLTVTPQLGSPEFEQRHALSADDLVLPGKRPKKPRAAYRKQLMEAVLKPHWPEGFPTRDTMSPGDFWNRAKRILKADSRTAHLPIKSLRKTTMRVAGYER
jgi:hypothetical protein